MSLQKFALIVGFSMISSAILLPTTPVKAGERHWFYGQYRHYDVNAHQKMRESRWRKRHLKRLRQREWRHRQHQRRRGNDLTVFLDPRTILGAIAMIPGTVRSNFDPIRDLPPPPPLDRDIRIDRNEALRNDRTIVAAPKPKTRPTNLMAGYQNGFNDALVAKRNIQQKSLAALAPQNGKQNRSTSADITAPAPAWVDHGITGSTQPIRDIIPPKTAQGITTTPGTSRLLTCTKAQQVIENFGFSDVQTAQCTGNVYSFNARRDGQAFKLKLSAINGELTEVRRQ